MFKYPKPISSESFPAYTPTETTTSEDQEPDERSGVAPLVSDPTSRGVLGLPKSGNYGVTRLTLISSDVCSPSLHEGQTTPDPIDPKPFFVAPGLDALGVGWNMPNHGEIKKVTFELFSASQADTAVAKAVWEIEDEDARLTKDPDEDHGCTGTVTWNKDFLTFEGDLAEDFPDGLPTAKHSPYQLRATVEPNEASQLPGYPLIATTQFHVAVGKIELAWGEESYLPEAANGCDALHEGTWSEREKKILTALKTNDDPCEQLNKIVFDHPIVSGSSPLKGTVTTKVDDTVIKGTGTDFAGELVVGTQISIGAHSTTYSVTAINGTDLTIDPKIKAGEAQTDATIKLSTSDFAAEHKKVWGDGPRIPLVAKALVRRANGELEVDAKALTGLKLYWDWNAPPKEGWQTWLGKAPDDDSDDWLKTSSALDRAFLTKLIDDAEREEGLSPPGAVNCPAAYGGRLRLKGDDPDLPVFANDEKLPFTVSAAPEDANRRWAAISEFGTDDAAGTSGVLLSPGRIVGDAYTVTVYLGVVDGEGKNALDLKESELEEPKTLLGQVEAEDENERLPTATAQFRVYRQLDMLYYAFPSTIPSAWLTESKAYYERAAGLILNVDVARDLPGSFRDAARYADGHEAMYRTQATQKPYDEGSGQYKPESIQLAIYHALEAPGNATLDDARKFLPTRDHDAYQDAIRKAFKDHKVYALELEAALTMDAARGNPEVKADTATGWLIGKAPFGNPNTYLVLSKNDVAFAKDKDLTFESWTYKDDTLTHTSAQDKKVKITAVLDSASAWLQTSIALSKGTDEKKVKATIGGESVTVTYSKGTFSRKVSKSLSDSAKTSLKDALVRAVNAHGDGLFKITVEGKMESRRDQERTGGVRAYLKSLLEDGTVIDNYGVYAEFASQGTSLFRRADYPEGLTDCTDFLFSRLQKPWQEKDIDSKKGLIYLCFERRSDGDINAGGATFSGDNLSHLAVAYQTSPGRHQRPKQKFVEPVPLLVHELGHALTLDHAVSRLLGGVKSPAAENAGEDAKHVKYTGCVMNYDPTPESNWFCAMCLLRLRAWDMSSVHRYTHLVDDTSAEIDEDAAIKEAVKLLDEDKQHIPESEAWLELAAGWALSKASALSEGRGKDDKKATDLGYGYENWPDRKRWQELNKKKNNLSRKEAKEFDKLTAQYNIEKDKAAREKSEYLRERSETRKGAADALARVKAAAAAYEAVDARYSTPLGTIMLRSQLMAHYAFGDVEKAHEFFAKLDDQCTHVLDVGEVRYKRDSDGNRILWAGSAVNDLSPTYWHLDMLGTRSHEYRVTLELGDVDELFSAPATSKTGKMERLQVLGLLNRPLKHQKADDAFAFAWDYAKTLFDGLEGDPGGILKKAISEYLVEGGALPVPHEVSKARVFGGYTVNYSQTGMMIMFPADKYPKSEGYQEGKHAKEQPFSKYMLGAERWDVENSFYDDNPALGRIPIVAKIEQRPRGGEWKPADKGVRVYFELLAPDALPDPQAIADPEAVKHGVAGGFSFYDQSVAPALEANPKKYLEDVVDAFHPADPADPQAGNAHFIIGGKRSLTPGNVSEPLFQAIDNVFCGTKAQGFKGLKPEGSGEARDHQVCIETDSEGLAKITFCPSRIGGDRYRFRAYVGPPTRNAKGDSDDVCRDETGTFVVWRTVRISRHVKVDGSASEGELPDYFNGQEFPKDKASKHYGAVADLDLKGYVTKELAKSYCELVLDPNALAPQKLSTLGGDILETAKALREEFDCLNRPNVANEWSGKLKIGIFREQVPDEAWNEEKTKVTYDLGCKTPEPSTLSIRPRGGGKSDAIAVDTDGSGTLGELKGGLTSATLSYTTGKLVAEFGEAQEGGLDVCYYPKDYLDLDSLLVFPDKSPFLFNLRLPDDYNAKIANKGFKPIGKESSGNPDAATYIRDGYMGLTKNWLSTALARAGHGGFLPGLSIFQAVTIDTYDGLWGGIGTQEGKGVESTILLFGTKSGDEYNRLALHEISHGLYLQHAPGGGATGAQEDLHAKGTGDTCVMSYAANDGDHCGQCVANLRGMSVRHKPFIEDE